MSTDAKIWFMIVGLLVFAFVAAGFSFVYGQQQQQTTTTTAQKVEDVQEQVEGNTQQIDATTGMTIGSAAVGGLALAREYFNTKKLKKEDRSTDKDVGNSLLIRYRLIQAMEVYVPGMKEALDQPFNTDTMQKDVTIRRKIAEDSQGWAEYMMTVLQAFPPSMTPSASVALASSQNIQTANSAPAASQPTKTENTATAAPPSNNTAKPAGT